MAPENIKMILNTVKHLFEAWLESLSYISFVFRQNFGYSSMYIPIGSLDD